MTFPIESHQIGQLENITKLSQYLSMPPIILGFITPSYHQLISILSHYLVCEIHTTITPTFLF